jgi:acrylyl-CoA reductase (NADPH)
LSSKTLPSNIEAAATAATPVTAVVAEGPKGGPVVKQFASLAELPRPDPKGDVIVKVEYSTLNYKDGLALTGQKGVTKGFPLVGGIDLTGEVIESQSDTFKAGEKVVLTGNYIGQHYDGGLSTLAKVRSSWLLPLPATLSTRTAMAIGTAGFAAMQCVLTIEDILGKNATGDLLVTGAPGGVASTALAILKHRGTGFKVFASTLFEDLKPLLLELGADEVIGPVVEEKKPLAAERWTACIDAVGGAVLQSVIPAMKGQGVIACCGNAGGTTVKTTVFPLILRGVKICGVDTVSTISLEYRQRVWAELAKLPGHIFEQLVFDEIPLDGVPAATQKLMKGQMKGRCLVKV